MIPERVSDQRLVSFKSGVLSLDLGLGRNKQRQFARPEGRVDLKVRLVHALRRRLRDPDEDLEVLVFPEELLPDDPPPGFLRRTAFFVVPGRDEPRLLPRFVCPRERLWLAVPPLLPDSASAVSAACSTAWPVPPAC